MFARHHRTIAEQVQIRMDALEWKQTKLAKKAGLAQRTVNNLMNPDRGIAPTMRTIEAIVRALNCDIADLLAPLNAEEAALLAAYRRAKAGRKEAALALLDAPEKDSGLPPALPPPPSHSERTPDGL
jgi:transcriptional regulator with XRE-family HTH domain